MIGATAERETPGAPPFEFREKVQFSGSPGDTVALATGVAYEFDWPGALRQLDRQVAQAASGVELPTTRGPQSVGHVQFGSDEDYWAYNNDVDYIDRLEIIVESRSKNIVLSGGNDCAIVWRSKSGNPIRAPCTEGEELSPELTKYGRALVATFYDLRPGDDAILKYSIRRQSK